MTDYEFTEAEQAAIEKSAERLEHVLVNLDAIDAAYDIAQAIQPALAAEAVAKLGRDLMEEGIEYALHHLVGEKHAVFVLNLVRAEGVEDAARTEFGSTLTADGAVRARLYAHAKKVRATPLPGSLLAEGGA
jgi:hypothetical protein